MEDASLVTETMARVYAKQGLFEKARKAYQHLSLKYPAKSTYFALQLKKLEDPASGLGTSNE
jgi:pentatricopeptide repeat protein